MTVTWDTIGAAALTGLASGAIASLIAPWVHWGVEKRRARLERRGKLLQIAGTVLANSSGKSLYAQSEAYARLRPFLLPEVIAYMETDHITVVLSGRHKGADNFKVVIKDEISRLERDWHLI